MQDLIDWAGADRKIRQIADPAAVYLVGHSRGGKVATLAAAADPRVGALCLLDPVDNTVYAPLGPGYPSAAAALSHLPDDRALPVAIVGARPTPRTRPSSKPYHAGCALSDRALTALGVDQKFARTCMDACVPLSSGGCMRDTHAGAAGAAVNSAATSPCVGAQRLRRQGGLGLSMQVAALRSPTRHKGTMAGRLPRCNRAPPPRSQSAPRSQEPTQPLPCAMGGAATVVRVRVWMMPRCAPRLRLTPRLLQERTPPPLMLFMASLPFRPHSADVVRSSVRALMPGRLCDCAGGHARRGGERFACAWRLRSDGGVGARAGGGVGGDCAPTGSNYRQFYDAAPSVAWEVVVSGGGHFQFLDRQSLLQQAVCRPVRSLNTLTLLFIL